MHLNLPLNLNTLVYLSLQPEGLTHRFKNSTTVGCKDIGIKKL